MNCLCTLVTKKGEETLEEILQTYLTSVKEQGRKVNQKLLSTHKEQMEEERQEEEEDVVQVQVAQEGSPKEEDEEAAIQSANRRKKGEPLKVIVKVEKFSSDKSDTEQHGSKEQKSDILNDRYVRKRTRESSGLDVLELTQFTVEDWRGEQTEEPKKSK